MNTTQANQITKEAIELLNKELSEKLNVTFEFSGGTINDGFVMSKIKIVETRDDGKSLEEIEFNRRKSFYGLDGVEYMAKFRARGEIYQICHINPRGRKYPIIGVSPSGKRYKFTQSVVCNNLV